MIRLSVRPSRLANRRSTGNNPGELSGLSASVVGPGAPLAATSSTVSTTAAAPLHSKALRPSGSQVRLSDPSLPPPPPPPLSVPLPGIPSQPLQQPRGTTSGIPPNTAFLSPTAAAAGAGGVADSGRANAAAAGPPMLSFESSFEGGNLRAAVQVCARGSHTTHVCFLNAFPSWLRIHLRCMRTSTTSSSPRISTTEATGVTCASGSSSPCRGSSRTSPTSSTSSTSRRRARCLESGSSRSSAAGSPPGRPPQPGEWPAEPPSLPWRLRDRDLRVGAAAHSSSNSSSRLAGVHPGRIPRRRRPGQAAAVAATAMATLCRSVGGSSSRRRAGSGRGIASPTTPHRTAAVRWRMSILAGGARRCVMDRVVSVSQEFLTCTRGCIHSPACRALFSL